jgi:hypothetical protein
VEKRAPGVEMTLFRSNFTVDGSTLGGAHFVGVVHKVAAYSKSITLDFCFVGTLCGDKASICCLMTWR